MNFEGCLSCARRLAQRGRYHWRMARTSVRTIRLNPEDARALKRAEADGISASELVGRGLRIVAAHYYRKTRRRPPKIGLLISTDPRLCEESELFKEFRD